MGTSAEAIQRIIELAPETIVKVNELEYSTCSLTLIETPRPKAVSVETLSGFIKMMEAGLESFDAKSYVVQVESFEKVILRNLHSDEYGRRQELLVAAPLKGITKFPYFNDWGPQEEFIIGLLAHFQETPDLETVTGLVSHIDATVKSRTVDNKVTQEVTISQGVAFKQDVEVKHRLKLAPFRTFREFGQPVSEFIFRVKDSSKFALFEADGGAWKFDAVKSIAEFLTNSLRSSAVESLTDIPVIL